MPRGATAAKWVQPNGSVSITDNFNRANNASSLGTTSDSTKVWSALLGTWGISSNQGYCSVPDGSSLSYAVVDSGVTFGAVQVTIPTTGGGGIAFRVQDANNYYRFYSDNSGRLIFGKMVAGTPGQIASQFITLTAGDILRAEFTGTSFTLKRNGSVYGTYTDSSLTTGTKVGLFAFGSSPTIRFDDFSFTSP